MTTENTAPAASSGPDLEALVASGAIPSVEHGQQMLAAQPKDPVLATNADIADQGRPAHVPEKFWDPVNKRVRVDELVKSYSELEKMRGKPAEAAQEAPAEASQETPPEAKPGKIERKEDKPAEGEASPLVTAIESLKNHYAETGGNPTEEAIQAAVDAGLPREVIETHLAAVKALEAAQLLKVHEAAGGQEAFDSAMAWATKSMSDEDLAVYNAMVDNPATEMEGVRFLVSKFRAAVPSEGSFVDAEPSSSAAGDVFASSQEMTAAMRDPRYGRDPAYRAQVAEKIARSKKAGSLQTHTQHFSKGRR